MAAHVPDSGVPQRIWKFFASVKLTVGLLLTLAATSVLGTLIPQNADPALYFQKYGEKLFRLFWFFDLFDMYHSWWFQFLLLLMTVNLLVCSVDRLSSTWRVIFPRKRRCSTAPSLKSCRTAKASALTRPGRTAGALSAPAGASLPLQPAGRHRPTAGCFLPKRDAGGRLGAYVVHLGVLLLLMGGLIGSWAGFEGFVNIPEKESIDSVQFAQQRSAPPAAVCGAPGPLPDLLLRRAAAGCPRSIAPP